MGILTVETKFLKRFESFRLGFCRCDCNTELNEIYDYRWNTLRKFIHGHNARGINNPAYKGKYKMKQGYIRVWKPDHHFASGKGYVMEHRLVYEEFHKCILLPWAEIHHINGIKDDNKIENLTVTDRPKHQSIHHKKDMSNRICFLCGSNKTKVRKDGYVNWCLYPEDKTKFICMKCYKRLSYNKKT